MKEPRLTGLSTWKLKEVLQTLQKVRDFKETEKYLKCCFQVRSGFSSSEIFLVVSKLKMERKKNPNPGKEGKSENLSK